MHVGASSSLGWWWITIASAARSLTRCRWRSSIVPEVRVPGLSDYPWGTWLSWTLEERIACLGWAAQWLGDQEAREAAAADLAALARWPSWGEYPGLSSPHLGRTLWRAATHWPWVDEALRRSLRDACIRHVESVLPACDKTYGAVHTKEDVLARRRAERTAAQHPADRHGGRRP